MVKQRIDQRAGLGIAGGMDGHTSRLIHDNQSGIFIQDIKWNGFRFNCLKGTRGGKRERNLIAGSELVAGLGRFAVYGYGTFSNQFLNVCSGQGKEGRHIRLCLHLLWKLCFDKAVKPNIVWREVRVRRTFPERGKVENLRL